MIPFVLGYNWFANFIRSSYNEIICFCFLFVRLKKETNSSCNVSIEGKFSNHIRSSLRKGRRKTKNKKNKLAKRTNRFIFHKSLVYRGCMVINRFGVCLFSLFSFFFWFNMQTCYYHEFLLTLKVSMGLYSPCGRKV